MIHVVTSSIEILCTKDRRSWIRPDSARDAAAKHAHSLSGTPAGRVDSIRWGKFDLKDIRPCGSWPSPIGSADLVRGALRLSAPRLEGGRLFWLEARPSEAGRQVVMVGTLKRAAGLGGIREASPADINVRTRVHEYGGGEYAVWRDRIYFVDDSDGRIHVGAIGGPSRPITPPGSCYADLLPSPDGRWLLAVEERPRAEQEPENRVVAIPLSDTRSAIVESAGPPHVVAAGHDFYASLVFAPDGGRLAFLAWDHPNMPWNGTFLEVVHWGTDGPRGVPKAICGGPRESLFQPRFAANGTLFVASDRSGFWNLERVGESGLQPVHRDRVEIGHPQWVFGLSRWDFLDAGSVVASATRDGCDVLCTLELESGRLEERMTGFSTIGGVEARDGWVACIAGSPTAAASLYVWEDEDRSPRCVRESAPFAIPESTISRAEVREFSSIDGRTTHAFVYAPCSDAHAASPTERFPLLVKSHGGPTSATSSALDPRIQYWTTRGFTVADVNYSGSSGYGRAYRDRLESAWGIVDVEDCVAVARALADEGLVDAARLAISGGSAGGYTTLCALTFHDTFAAGASHYGIGDLEALARDTHKFESRYTDWLVGPLPEARERYVERSPIHHYERLDCPVIFFQGLEDRVVPPNQAEAMVSVLAKRGIPHAYVPFEGEQHGFRRAENIRTALDGELYFYSRIFGFDAPHPAGVHVRESGS
jgi:dipeptidyl aminopeptidase/acylaminoacyl peptidase